MPETVDSASLVALRRLGGEGKLGKLFMPNSACELLGGLLVVAENVQDARLPVISLESGQLMRHLVPLDRAFDRPVALCLSEDGAALIVIETSSIIKLNAVSGAELQRRDEAEEEIIFTGGSIVAGVLYVVNHRGGCVRSYDPHTLEPRAEHFGHKHTLPVGSTEFPPYPEAPLPLAPDALIEPYAVRAHPEGVMVLDASSHSPRIVVFDPATCAVVRQYTTFVSPWDALVLGGGTMMVVDDGQQLVQLEVASGKELARRKLREDTKYPPFVRTLLPLSSNACAGADATTTFAALEMLPESVVHVFRADGVTSAMNAPRVDRPIPTPSLLATGPSYDMCVVGAGAVGCCIARDVASLGYSVLLVEADREVGGVWQRNKYPNLRLHAPGHSYRALSCAPAWQAPDQRSNESAAERMAYRPEQKEILAYIQSLVEHPKITLQTGTAFCYSEARAGSGFNARHRIVCARASGESYTSDVRAVVHCIGAYEVTAGRKFMPFNPTTVTNGAKVVHSSELSANLAAWEAAPHRYVVGASKAALDVITSLDVAEAESGRLTWAHRGHIIFTNREKVSVAPIGEGLPHTEKAQAQAQAVEVMKGMIQGTATGNQLLKNQAFEGYCKMFLSSGKGHYVREPLSRMGTAQRGGVESEANIEHARQFIKCEKLVESVQVVDGAVHLVGANNSGVIIPGPNDVIVMCTGQRAEGFGPGYHSRCATHNADGVFMPYGLSGTAPCLATYWTSIIVQHLDGTRNNYSSGSFSAAAHNVADHMEMLRDKSPWASFMTFLGTNQLDVAGLIFPWAAVGSGDLAGSYHWVEWYGRDLDVRRVIKTLSANEFLFDQSDSETGATGGASVGSAEGTVSLK